MGYPGKPTDDVMELVRKLRTLAERRGTLNAHRNPVNDLFGQPQRVAMLDDQIEAIIDEIHSHVSDMDTSGDDYARDMGF